MNMHVLWKSFSLRASAFQHFIRVFAIRRNSLTVQYNLFDDTQILLDTDIQGSADQIMNQDVDREGPSVESENFYCVNGTFEISF